MSDYIKGFIIHLDKDIKDEYCEEIKIALRMVKCVRLVEPLIAKFEDHIAYMRGRNEIIEIMGQHFRDLMKNEIKGGK